MSQAHFIGGPLDGQFISGIVGDVYDHFLEPIFPSPDGHITRYGPYRYRKTGHVWDAPGVSQSTTTRDYIYERPE